MSGVIIITNIYHTSVFRVFTDLARNHALFSMALPSSDNGFLIFKTAVANQIDWYVLNTIVSFDGQQYTPNAWHNLCATWDNTTGLGQLWLDGTPSSRKFLRTGGIQGTPSILLGQVVLYS